jgi:spermidine/putrescine transport system substrate-binding protein
MIVALRFFFLLLLPLTSFAEESILNVYAWSGEIPQVIIQQFEKETGIKVNFSTYENNEIMYAKMRATKNPGYDVIIPYSSFVERMRRQNLLEHLDKSKLSNWKNLNPSFLNPTFDPQSQYSVPFIWGVTGIFVNDSYHPAFNNIKKWSDLWSATYYNQLLLLDDVREVFSMALITLGYSANDRDPEHIKAAYLKLKTLMKNVKVFSSDTVISIMIDEDATVGMGWNGDAFKASTENPNVKFIYPEEGFSIWIDNLAIPKNAPHKNAAYAFINFILRPDIAKTIALSTGYPITNLAGQKLLPEKIRNNPVAYPPKEILRHGEFITDVGEDALTLYTSYWEKLKLSG